MTPAMMAPDPRWQPVAWRAPPGVQAWQTWCGDAPERRFNLATHAGDGPATALANRAILQGRLPGRPRLTWLRQVHGTAVVALPVDDAHPEADAAVTRARGWACVVMTADCLPVLLSRDDGGVVAAAHAGWRGLAAGVLERTVAAMETPAVRLRAWLGPAIGAEAFEVGADVREAFVTDDPGAAAAFHPAARPGHHHADLLQLARRRLQALGLRDITSADLCTYTAADRCPSHRRDPTSGRMASLIWREAS